MDDPKPWRPNHDGYILCCFRFSGLCFRVVRLLSQAFSLSRVFLVFLRVLILSVSLPVGSFHPIADDKWGDACFLPPHISTCILTGAICTKISGSLCCTFSVSCFSLYFALWMFSYSSLPLSLSLSTHAPFLLLYLYLVQSRHTI